MACHSLCYTVVQTSVQLLILHPFWNPFCTWHIFMYEYVPSGPFSSCCLDGLFPGLVDLLPVCAWSLPCQFMVSCTTLGNSSGHMRPVRHQSPLISCAVLIGNIICAPQVISINPHSSCFTYLATVDDK